MSSNRGQLSVAPVAQGDRVLISGIATMIRGARLRPLAATAAIGLSLINGSMMVAGAAAIGWATENLVIPAFSDGRPQHGAAWIAAGSILAVSLLRMSTIIVRGVLTGVVQFRAQADSREQLVSKYLRLDTAWHRRHPAGRLMATAVSDVDMTWMAMTYFPFAAGMVFMLLVAGVRVTLVDAVLATIALTLIPVVLVVNLVYQRLLSPRARAAQAARGRLASFAHESLMGNEVVRTLGRQRDIEDRFRDEARGLRDANVRMTSITSIFDPLIELLPSAAILVVFSAGAGRYLDGELALGNLVELVYLLTTMAIPLNIIARFLSHLPLTNAGHERIREVLGANEEARYGERPAVREPLGVRFHEVELEYEDATAVSVAELRIAPGELVAVVGATGAGKSTLLRLAARIIDPTRGRVELGGTLATEYSAEAVTEMIAFVPEHGMLFADTVRGNVELDRPRLDAEVWEALESAAASEFVRELPHGLDTDVAGTSARQLSGGQRQRVTIARALLRRPRLLVLDDVSSSLDAITEARVLASIARYARGSGDAVTVLFSATRLASIALADRVVFLHAGRVVATGSHETLLAEHAAYRRLVGAYSVSAHTIDQPAEQA